MDKCNAYLSFCVHFINYKLHFERNLYFFEVFLSKKEGNLKVLTNNIYRREKKALFLIIDWNWLLLKNSILLVPQREELWLMYMKEY